MTLALIAILVSLAVLGSIALVLYHVWDKKKSSRVKRSGRTNPRTVSLTTASAEGKKGNSYVSAIQVKPGHSPEKGSVMDSLQPRFAVVGLSAAAIFASLGTRLWQMQGLSSEEYKKKAESNTYVSLSSIAPRGVIYDADGVALVKNKTSLTVLADADVANDRTLIQRLSVLLGLPHNVVKMRILDSSSGAQSQRVVASGVNLRDVAFIAEHAEAFPGISTEERSTREYPYGALAAHLLGYTGVISEEELGLEKEGVVYESGDIIGKSGIEKTYDSVIAGTRGQRVVITDADGSVRQVISETDPTKGNDVYLTIRASVQHVADRALAELIAPNGIIGEHIGSAASLVCMDVTDGSIIAMSSYPTYTPESFIGGISQETWDLFISEESHYPLLNRAIEGTYPAASTFKAFTGMAGLEYGFADSERTWNCEGTWVGFGDEYPQNCHLLTGHGHINFRYGVVESCDVVFYEIAKSFYSSRGEIGDTAMQDFITSYGFGKTTGIDLGGEQAGVIPTPDWKKQYFADAPEEAEWRPGDMSNMAIGQGYVKVTPLQMAVAYASLATGDIMRPHLLREVKNSEGDTVIKHESEVVSSPEVKPETLEVMREALRAVATDNAGIRNALEQHSVYDAIAKTGTAEVSGKQHLGWFAAYAPYDNPKYVVVCTVEEGGSGVTSAEPVSAEVLRAAFLADEGSLDEELTPISGSTGQSVKIAPADYGRED